MIVLNGDVAAANTEELSQYDFYDPKRAERQCSDWVVRGTRRWRTTAMISMRTALASVHSRADHECYREKRRC